MPHPEDALQDEAGGTEHLAPSFPDLRQRSRLPEGFVLENRAVPFDPRLAYELALKIDDPATVFERYGIEQDEALRLMGLTAFRDAILKFDAEIKEHGIGFRSKARVIAEELLEHGHDIATDASQSGAVRADLIKWFAKVGDLEPAPKKNDGGDAAARYQFQIIFSGSQPAQTMTIEKHQPVTIEGETE